MAVDLTNKIHGDFSKETAVWKGYRGEITGAYITGEGTGANYVVYSNKLIREYNEKISELAQPDDLYIEPYDAGFRYVNDPLLGTYNGAAGAYSTRTVGFGGVLMKVRKRVKPNHFEDEEGYIRGDSNGNISLGSPVIPTGGRAIFSGSADGYADYKTYSFIGQVAGADYRITYIKNEPFSGVSGYFEDNGYLANLTYDRGNQAQIFNDAIAAPSGVTGLLVWPYQMVYLGTPNWLVVSKTDNVEYGVAYSNESAYWVINVDPVYGSMGRWIGDATGYCTVWYDQSATGAAQNNLTQTTAADQPMLVNAGTLITDSSGTAALDFNGSTQHMVLDTGFSSTINISGLSSYVVFENDATGSAQMVSTLGSFADSNKRWYSPYINVGKFNYAYGTNNPLSSDTANTNLNLVSLVADSTQGDLEHSEMALKSVAREV